jgi:hypothetical protein
MNKNNMMVTHERILNFRDTLREIVTSRNNSQKSDAVDDAGGPDAESSEVLKRRKLIIKKTINI